MQQVLDREFEAWLNSVVFDAVDIKLAEIERIIVDEALPQLADHDLDRLRKTLNKISEMRTRHNNLKASNGA